MNPNQIVIYETEDNKVRIDVLFDRENVWLTQKLMAELFECAVDNISLHLKNIFSEGELDERSVIEEYSIAAVDMFSTHVGMNRLRHVCIISRTAP